MRAYCPLNDQLAEDYAPADGGPDENAGANCVPACLASGLMGMFPGLHVNGDDLVDAVYGDSYRGATDPGRFAGYLKAKYNADLAGQWDQNRANLIAVIRQQLDAGQRATGAIPSMWGNDFSRFSDAQMAAFDSLGQGGTHEVIWCDYDAGAGTLTAMNPWPVNGSTAFYQTQSWAWWQQRIVYGRVFRFNGGITPVWVRQSDGTGRDSQGHNCGAGDMNFILATPGLVAADGLMSEQFYTPDDSMLPLANGWLVHTHHDVAHGQWVTDANAASVAVALWQQLQAAKAGNGGGNDPAGESAKAAIRALKAAEGIVQ